MNEDYSPVEVRHRSREAIPISSDGLASRNRLRYVHTGTARRGLARTRYVRAGRRASYTECRSDDRVRTRSGQRGEEEGNGRERFGEHIESFERFEEWEFEGAKVRSRAAEGEGCERTGFKLGLENQRYLVWETEEREERG